MKLFSKNKNKEDIVLLFDIGSASLGAAFVLRRHDELPKILFSFRENITIEKDFDFDRFLASTIKSLDIVVDKVFSEKKFVPEKVFCVLSSPWYASQTRNIKLSKDKDFIFTEKLLNDLSKQEINLFEEENLSKYLHDNNKVRLIEFKNMKTMLNGYFSISPFGKKARDINITSFISASPEEILSKIENSINRHFNNKKISFLSFSMASFMATRDVFNHEEDFLLIDIGGEITDISMIKKDVLTTSISFPIGSNLLIKQISEDLHCSINEAISFLSLYLDGHAGKSTDKDISKVLDSFKKDWISKFQESLFSFSTDISIPSNIFLSVDENIGIFFKEAIKDEKFNQYSFTESKFNIVILNTDILHNFIKLENGVLHDSFLSIESIYINRFFI